MDFFGVTTLHVGLTEQDDRAEKDKDSRRGRKETFLVPQGHELLGCTLYHADKETFGVEWLTWRPPRVYA